jgi:hypothetical protein
MSYLVALVAVVAALVVAGVVDDDELSLHPVNAPTTSPNSTIRVYIRFIGAATFY